MRTNSVLILFIVSFLLCTSCSKDDDNLSEFQIRFEHSVDGMPIEFDNMKYTNAAGNKYEVTEIQWFASDIILNKKDGSKIVMDNENFAHYIDTNLPGTLLWKFDKQVNLADVQSISMTFGINGEKNIPFMYPNPPESDMLWPITLGGDNGGYHYMKLNGFWNNEDDQRTPFNFHLGVGQERDAENNITGFVQNWFEVELPIDTETAASEVNLRMNVEKWWESPNMYDHNKIGGMIMQNQTAMKMGVENGRNAFSISKVGPVTEDAAR